MEELKGVEPVGTFVLVSVIEKEQEENKSGIITNIYNTPELTNKCKVLRIGKEVKEIEEGKTYIFNTRSGVNITYKEKEYLLLNEKSNDFYIKID